MLESKRVDANRDSLRVFRAPEEGRGKHVSCREFPQKGVRGKERSR